VRRREIAPERLLDDDPGIVPTPNGGPCTTLETAWGNREIVDRRVAGPVPVQFSVVTGSVVAPT